MANPVFVNSTPFIYFTCDRDPTSTEPVVSAIGIPAGWLFWWWNTTTNDIFTCQNGSATPGSLVWWKQVSSLNIASMIPASVSQLNTLRNYFTPSLSFGSSRSPSATNDVMVIANISQSNTLLTNTTVNALVNTGVGMVTIVTTQMSGVLATTITPMTFIVPKGASYQLVASGTGTNTLSSIREILL